MTFINVRPACAVYMCICWLFLTPCCHSADPSPIWIEGEDNTEMQVARNGWYDSVKKDVLSGGRWLSHFTNRSEKGRATYQFTVTATGTYTFWLRGNPLRSRITWQLDRQSARIIPWEDVRGRMNIASDNKPDMRFLAWTNAGKVRLSAGPHTLRLTLEKGDDRIPNHGAVDCMVFVRTPWVPSGKEKPGAGHAVPLKPDTWFPVPGMTDPLPPESVIDMSRLIDAPAGRHGFLKQDGHRLRFERASKPVKFWAIGSNMSRRDTQEKMTRAARWYRKMGINLVRQHTVTGDVGLPGPDGRFPPDRLRQYDRWFASLKAEGIYTTWSIIYPHHQGLLRSSDGLDPNRFKAIAESDFNKDHRRGAYKVNDLINLDRDLQDITLKLFDRLLNHKNPFTGLKYKDDPALAVVEFQNESNIFFHTLNSLRQGKPPYYAKFLRQRFFQFIQKKYGSRAGTAQAWGNRWDRDDRWEDGELGLMAPFHWGQDGPQYEYAGQLRRCGDYIQFLAGIQRGYYERRVKALRAMGFKGVLVTTAWKGVGGASLANLWCDSAAGMIDRHNYFGGGDGGHSITEGKVSNATHLSQPGRGLFNLGLFQVADKPFCVSEWSMMPPSPWKAEAAPLFAFYGMGLQGWDMSCHFACSQNRMGDGWPGQSKYKSNTPHYMGQFPALAFAIHKGHIKEGQVVAARRVGNDQIYAGRDVLGQSIAQGGHDTKVLGGNVATPPEALAAGRVTIAFDRGKATMADLSRYWDRNKKVITSSTKELAWHYGERYFEVRSPKTQAVVGFAGGRTIRLPGVTAHIKTPFVSLIFTPLDDRPLVQSRHILITAMARDKQKGAEFNPDWSRLTTMGGPPLLMEPVQADIQFKSGKPVMVRPLDFFGVPKPGKPLAMASDGRFRIDGTHATYYYEVKR